MKRKYRLFIIIGAVVLTVAWGWRFLYLNQYFSERYGVEKQEYHIGDTVSLGDNMMGGSVLDGYSVNVKSAEIMECDDFLKEYGTSAEEMELTDKPERICKVILTISNRASQAEGVYLPDLTFYGTSFYGDWNDELIALANPVLEGSLGIALPENSDYEITMIYNLRKMHFTSYSWNHIRERTFWLKVTDFPVMKTIRILN